MQIDWNLVLSTVTLLTVIIAFFTYQSNIKAQEEDRIRDSNKELIRQIELSLEWSYATLVNTDVINNPMSSRLNWLTCARHLRRQEEIAQEISDGVYKIIYEEKKEYWRHQFYLFIQDAVKSTDYFISRRIEPASAFIIIDFCNWPQGKKDPTDELTPESIAEKLDNTDYSSISPMGYLEKYLKNFPIYQEYLGKEETRPQGLNNDTH